ncbi:MAG: nickel pincer cofactor biosynthesis protein LarB [Bacteroidota bacterium]
MNTFHIDWDREGRLGFPEVIYGAGKSPEVLLELLASYVADDKNALITKLQAEKAPPLLRQYPDAFFDQESGIFLLREEELSAQQARIGIVAGGTSDLFVVNEIHYTLQYLGIRSERIVDVGVSGLHRLLSRLDHLKSFSVLIGVAGFEAALPTVLGGLLPQPIIAVPTSVGYGVGEGGKAALHALLASCANGITVVNIDNGYGAAIAAFRMLGMGNSESL